MSLGAHVIKTAIKKRAEIARRLESPFSGELLKRAKDVWVSYEPKVKEAVVCASDGSRNRKNYIGFVLYAVGAVGVSNYGGSFKEAVRLADVDILEPQELSETRLRFLMGTLEAKALLKTAEMFEHDVLLFDGSIVGNVLRPSVKSPLALPELSEEDRNLVIEAFKFITDTFSLEKLNAREFKEDFSKSLPGRRYLSVMTQLEYLEYLYSHYLLLKEFSNKLICVSKTSSSHIYFEEVRPDIVIFQYSNPTVGFSFPASEASISFDDLIFKSVVGSEEFKISEFFIRLRANSNIMKVESAISAEYVMDVLSNIEVKGYPFPLKFAHDSCLIDKRTIDKVEKVLGISLPSGREPLDF